MLSVVQTIMEDSICKTGSYLTGIQSGYSPVGGPKANPPGSIAKYETVPKPPTFKIDAVLTSVSGISKSIGSKLKGIPVMPNV